MNISVACRIFYCIILTSRLEDNATRRNGTYTTMDIILIRGVQDMIPGMPAAVYNFGLDSCIAGVHPRSAGSLLMRNAEMAVRCDGNMTAYRRRHEKRSI